MDLRMGRRIRKVIQLEEGPRGRVRATTIYRKGGRKKRGSWGLNQLARFVRTVAQSQRDFAERVSLAARQEPSRQGRRLGPRAALQRLSGHAPRAEEVAFASRRCPSPATSNAAGSVVIQSVAGLLFARVRTWQA